MVVRVDALVSCSFGAGCLLLLSTVLRVKVGGEALLRWVVLEQALIFLDLHVQLLEVAEVLQVELEIIDLLRRQLLAHLEVQVLADEAHRHDRLGNAREAQLLAIDSAWVWYQYGHRHFFGLHLVLRKLELEHLALVAQVDLLLLRLVGEWNAGYERTGWLGPYVEQEVAF